MKLIFSAVIAAALVFPARAEDKPKEAKSSWATFLKSVRSTLAASAVGGERKKGNRVLVAAVRGRKQKNMADPNEPTLKGDKSSAKAKAEAQYDSELDLSVALIEIGELEKALAGLEAFKTAHPKHHAGDVDKLIEGVKAQIAERGVAAPAVKE
jgi:hypothetical protein